MRRSPLGCQVVAMTGRRPADFPNSRARRWQRFVRWRSREIELRGNKGHAGARDDADDEEHRNPPRMPHDRQMNVQCGRGPPAFGHLFHWGGERRTSQSGRVVRVCAAAELSMDACARLRGCPIGRRVGGGAAPAHTLRDGRGTGSHRPASWRDGDARPRTRDRAHGGLVNTFLGTASGVRNIGTNAGIAVGGYIALAGLWASSFTGASMNPARTLASRRTLKAMSTSRGLRWQAASSSSV